MSVVRMDTFAEELCEALGIDMDKTFVQEITLRVTPGRTYVDLKVQLNDYLRDAVLDGVVKYELKPKRGEL